MALDVFPGEVHGERNRCTRIWNCQVRAQSKGDEEDEASCEETQAKKTHASAWYTRTSQTSTGK